MWGLNCPHQTAVWCFFRKIHSAKLSLFQKLGREASDEEVAKKLNLSEAKIFGVATFYENFSFEAKGKYVIKVCDGTACHVRHSTPVLEALWNELGLSKEKHTTDDLMFTVETVSCLGACGLAPVLTVNDDVYGRLTVDDLDEILAKYE